MKRTVYRAVFLRDPAIELKRHCIDVSLLCLLDLHVYVREEKKNRPYRVFSTTIHQTKNGYRFLCRQKKILYNYERDRYKKILTTYIYGVQC